MAKNLAHNIAYMSLILNLSFWASISAAQVEYSEDLARFWKGWDKVKYDEVQRAEFGHGFALTVEPIIIEAMIRDLRRERDDGKFLAYLHVVLHLPSQQASDVLLRVEKLGSPVDRMWATEFLAEIKDSGLRKARRKYRN